MTADGLVVERLTVRFGGVRAVDDVDLSAPVACITGLIGPNGAGKTTTFNACTGLGTPQAGSVSLFGVDLRGRGPAARAALGLGRTFQRIELFDSLSVEANVALGLEARLAGGSPFRQLVARRGEREAIRAVVGETLALCGLESIASRRAGALSTGQRRLVELARALAGDFRVLLLDEPSSGLDRVETARFGEILREVVATRGTGILLVEHDMSLVMRVCSFIHVLDFGKLAFAGSPDEVRRSDVVRAAYLGAGVA
jgi:ABC-type branched-subunit amino acid transport system ATPase component